MDPTNKINLAVRFFLEITSLVVFAFFGWGFSDGVAGIVLALGLHIIAAVTWGVFNVPNDPSMSGKAPIPVPGFVRLLLEFTFFTLAVCALLFTAQITAAWLFGLVVCVHYAVSYKRLVWLLHR